MFKEDKKNGLIFLTINLIIGSILIHIISADKANAQLSKTQVRHQTEEGLALSAELNRDFCSLNVVKCGIAVEATAYTWTGYLMYNGEYPREGVIAIKLPNKYGWRIGDKFLIDGREYEALDRLPSYQRADIDIYVDSRDEAIEFGRQTLKYKIIK